MLTNAVNGNAGGEPLLDVRDHAVGQLGVVGIVQVVVVDVEFGVGVSLARSLEGDAHEILAQDAIEDRVPHGAIFVEDLVHDVPLQNLALVSARDVGNVVLDHRRQRVPVVGVLHPLRQLRVPE